MAKIKNMLGQVLGSLLGSGNSSSGNTSSSSGSAPAPVPTPAEAAGYGADLPEETDDGVYSPAPAAAAPEPPVTDSASAEEPAAPVASATQQPEPAANASTASAPSSSSAAALAAGSLGQTAASVRETATRLSRSPEASGAADDGLAHEEAARRRALEVHQQRTMRSLLNGAASESDETADTEEVGARIVRHYYNAA